MHQTSSHLQRCRNNNAHPPDVRAADRAPFEALADVPSIPFCPTPKQKHRQLHAALRDAEASALLLLSGFPMARRQPMSALDLGEKCRHFFCKRRER